MSLPWLRLIDTLIGVTDFALGRRAQHPAASKPDDGLMAGGGGALGHLETRLAGVVVAALKEAFDRDSRRLNLERDQIEAERQRAERALRLELLRQTADREIERLRLIAAVAVASWIGTLFFAVRLVSGGIGARIALGAGWALLLGAVAASFMAQTGIAKGLAQIDLTRDRTVESPMSSALAPWLVVIGLALIGLAVLIA
jgi:hypothetical protein